MKDFKTKALGVQTCLSCHVDPNQAILVKELGDVCQKDVVQKSLFKRHIMLLEAAGWFNKHIKSWL